VATEQNTPPHDMQLQWQQPWHSMPLKLVTYFIARCTPQIILSLLLYCY